MSFVRVSPKLVTVAFGGLVAIVAVVVPLSLAQAQSAPAPAAAPPATTAPAQPSGVPVTLTRPARRDVPVFLRGLGAVAATKTVLVRSRVDGTLDRVAFTEGDEIKAGELIAQIDPRPYQAALDQAMARRAADAAQLANARLDLTRSSELARNQYAAQQTVDTRSATVAQLEANLKADDAAIANARLNLDFTHITAPFTGRLGFRQVDPGNFVRAADPAGVGIVTLSEVRPIALTFTVPQDQLPAITAAMGIGKPKVFAYGGDDATLLAEGELLTIDNAIDAATGTIKVKALFPNTDSRLWPGQFVNARVQVAQRKAVLTVPSQAVQRGPNGLFVYTVKPDQTVLVKLVEVPQDNGQVAVIAKGLEDSDIVVLSGQSRLSNGAKVSAPPLPAS
jgi:multidrug efflux system membrane fusion protein